MSPAVRVSQEQGSPGDIPRMRCITVVAGALVLVHACSAGTPSERGASGARHDSASATLRGPLPLRSLLQEHNTGLRDSTRRVITDSASLARIWAQAYARRGTVPPVPRIDFAREMVIVAIMGVRNTGGYTIHVDSAVARAGELRVYVRRTMPGPTCGTTAAITEPVAMVAVPRFDGPVMFEEAIERTDCG